MMFVKKKADGETAEPELQDAGPFRGAGLISRPPKDVADGEIVAVPDNQSSAGASQQPAPSGPPGPKERVVSGLALRVRKPAAPAETPAQPAGKAAAAASGSASQNLGSLFGKLQKGLSGLSDQAKAAHSKAANLAQAAKGMPKAKSTSGGGLKSALARLKKPTEGKKKNKNKSSGLAGLALGASARANGSVSVLTELDGGRRVYWEVTSNDVKQLDQTPPGPTASYSVSDLRFSSGSSLSYGQAKDLALSEMGEDCRIVNATGAHGAVYASTVTRITELAQPTGPGLILLEGLLKDRGELIEDASLIAGFLLETQSGGPSFAVLYHVDVSRGEVVGPQVTINPENLDFTISQFAASKRIDAGKAKVVLYNNAEFISVFRNLQIYPNENVWAGRSVRKMLWTAALVSSAVATLSAMFAAQAYFRVSMLSHEQAKLAAAVKAMEAGVQGAISSSVVSFAHTQSVDVQNASDTAAQLWMPHTKVAMEVTAMQQRYRVTMPLTRGNFSSNRPSVLGRLAPNDVEPLLRQPPPAGCQREIPGFSGGINAIQITVNCQAAARPVHRYLLD